MEARGRNTGPADPVMWQEQFGGSREVFLEHSTPGTGCWYIGTGTGSERGREAACRRLSQEAR